MRRASVSRGCPRRFGAALLLAGLLGLLGCSALPESGPVRHESTSTSGTPIDAPFFSPPGPEEGASQSSVVSGFLTAMQANPLSTKVAREFLSPRVRSAWQPNRGTVVYEAFSVLPGSDGVRLRLSGVRRLDDRGGWQGGSLGRSESTDLDLVLEDGEWRIDNPPEALVVPTSFFNRSFERRDLYFFDQTDRVLLPDPVFIPRSQQSATNLVRGLLQGPGASLAQVSGSAFPRGTELELSVVVGEDGVAEVPLTRELLRATPAQTQRAAQQLSWTLGQVAGIDRIRMTVAGAAIPLASGVIDVPVARAADLDASGAADPTLLGLREGTLVEIFGDSVTPRPGALGSTELDARSLAAGSTRLATVSGDGTTLSTVSLASGQEELQPVEVVTGTDLARPSLDLFDDLWVVDRTGSGARVLLADGAAGVGAAATARELEVAGVTGEDVVAATVSYDGSRLAVVFANSELPQVAVVDVLRSEGGAVTGTGRPRVVSVARDGGPLVDVGWRDPATLATLRPVGEESSRVDLVAADGAPVIDDSAAPGVFRGVATSLLVSPRDDVPLRLVAEGGRLHSLDAGGGWTRLPARIGAAAYAP